MRTPLPGPLLGRAFTLAEAAAAGIGEKGLRSLERPFHGVRTDAPVTSVPQLARAYAARMPAAQHFSHATAAVLHGIPLPLHLERASTLHVTARRPAGIPRGRGVIGHHTATRELVRLDGLPASSLLDTWCELSTVLALDDLIAATDYLVTGDEPYTGRPPPCTLGELHEAAALRRGRRGVRLLDAALAECRYGPLSRMETFGRLLVVRGGLPEPAHNLRVYDSRGTLVAMVDLGFERWRVAVEYQSELHRERDRFRADIHRRERLEDVGWTVIAITVDDVTFRGAETVARIRSRLRARGAPV